MEWQNSLQILPGLHGAVAASEGVRVVIHPPNTQPFPFAEGYDVPPGYSASFGVRPRRNKRIGPPHGNCSHSNPFDTEDTNSDTSSRLTSADNKTSNSDASGDTDFSASSSNANKLSYHRYRRISCQKMCLQSHVVAECQCYDTSLPILPAFRRQKKRSTDYSTDEQEERTSVKPCRLNDELSDSCKDNATDDCLDALMTVYNRIKCARQTRDAVTRNTTLMEQCGCRPPCDEFQYDVSYSLSKWPATGFEGDSAYYDIFYVENFRERFNAPNKYVSQHFRDENRRDTMKDFTRLNVYISGDEGGVFVTRESAEFSVNRLISEIGGQLAIWVGVSAIAIAEIVELGALLVRNLATSKRKGSYNPSSNVSMNDSAMCSASSTLQNLSPTN
jgi:Amiloride-sensitive sodium channel